MADARRVLVFSPYASWRYHTALEATWGHALRLRGADVRFVTCDGLSRTCDVYRANLNPRGPLSCLECQSSVAGQLFAYGTPYRWLSGWLPPEVPERAEAWAAGLAREDLLEARWNDLPVGEWARTSAYSQHRTAVLDLEHPRVEAMLRELLVGTVCFAEALESLFRSWRPDLLLTLNGRFFAHWTAIEIARQHGVRFVTHERGLRRDSVRFGEGARTHDLEPLRRLWELWKDVPSSAAELEEVGALLEERRQGKNYSRLSFSPPAQEAHALRQALGLDERPLCVVFSSSDDETAAFEERRRGAFPRSRDFLPAVLELAERASDLQFVVRIHPNVQKAETGTNQGALQHALEMRARAPRNLRVVLPKEDVSSYTLVDLASLGIVYGSTIGLEMAVGGKPVLCAAQATYSHTGCVLPLEAPGDLEPLVREGLRRGVDRETARLALRWALRYFRASSIPFDLVREQPNYQASLAFRGLDELRSGRHATLDAVAAFLLGQRADVLDPPSAAERARTQADEDAWLARLDEADAADTLDDVAARA